MTTTELGQLTPAEIRSGLLLAELVRRGWTFTPTGLDDYGDPTEMFGVFRWLGNWTDALLFRGLDDAHGWRSVPGEPGITWEQSGGVADVVLELLDLPAPDALHAPRLVKAPAPRLWVPGTG